MDAYAVLSSKRSKVIHVIKETIFGTEMDVDDDLLLSLTGRLTAILGVRMPGRPLNLHTDSTPAPASALHVLHS